MRNFLLVAFIVLAPLITFGQSIEKNWSFESIETNEGESLFQINAKKDILTLENGNFSYQLEAKNNLKASGDYIFQNNLLVLFYTQPSDTIRRYHVTEISDSTLVFTEKNVRYAFKQQQREVVPIVSEEFDEIVPVEGFSMNSLWRGILGMITLLFVAFLFSSNRKAINWRTVGIGLAFQLVIAIGVLKISFIQGIFEGIGKVFISILDFTRAGSKFLFEGLVVDMDTFGFIFAFQVLPTIIFFSALTSVLFYLGIIQKVVKAFGWLLTRA